MKRALLLFAGLAVSVLLGASVDGHTIRAGRHGLRPQTFRSYVDVVRVDVLASRDRRPLTGLTADDFQVFDNGVPQRVQLVTTAGHVKVLLLLDVSSSLGWGDKMQALIRASQSLVEGLEPGDDASLITFSNRVSLRATALRSREVVEKELLIASGHTGGGTALWDALFTGLSFLARDAGRALMLVFTDGIDTVSWCKDKETQEVVRRAEAVVYAVTVPPLPPVGPEDVSARRGRLDAENRARASYVPMNLKEVVEESGGELFLLRQGEELTNAFVSILQEFRARYVLTYEPTGVRRDDGWHELRVRLKGKKGTIRARRGYYATSTKVSR